MKNTVMALVAVLLVALLAIGGWYLAESSRLQGETEAFAAEAEARELVEVAFVVEVPETTPADQIVYVSGSHPNLGAWQAAGLPLQRGEDGKYHGNTELLSGIEHEFKITRGTWGTVERDAEDNDRPNRPFNAAGDTTLNVAVARWVDGGKTVPGRQTLAGDVRLIAKVPSDLLAPRDVVVYLPPGYDTAENEQTRYPVLYVNDGQNLFNEATSFAGVEWGLDEALERLIAEGAVPPMIVVGVYNTEDRTAEYMPGQRVSTYGRMLINEVKPMIDQRYRTRPGREDTGIAGSSLGGLAALAVAQQNPETFGRVIALSPWLSDGHASGTTLLPRDHAAFAETRLYLDMGTAPTTNYPPAADPVADSQAFSAALESAGVAHHFTLVEGAGHQEGDWARRIADVLKTAYAD